MKINKLDFPKTISDLIFLGIKNPKEKADKVFEVKHKLTAHGFEKYMQYYFRNIEKYDIVELNGKTNDFDGGIDLIGEKNINGIKTELKVQCKKWSVKDITLDDISSFFGKVVSEEYYKNKDNIKLYYITTSKFTNKAKNFAKKNNIKAINLSDIYNLQDKKYYPLHIFKTDIENEEGEKELNKSFTKTQPSLFIHQETYEATGIEDNELLILLKQIRRDLVDSNNQLTLKDIAQNNTLRLLARERPHNMKALKEVTEKLSNKEKDKILKHGNIFIERLKYIHV